MYTQNFFKWNKHENRVLAVLVMNERLYWHLCKMSPSKELNKLTVWRDESTQRVLNTLWFMIRFLWVFKFCLFFVLNFLTEFRGRFTSHDSYFFRHKWQNFLMRVDFEFFLKWLWIWIAVWEKVFRVIYSDFFLYIVLFTQFLHFNFHRSALHC